MTLLEKTKDVSSAEITAIYRCAIPELSQDRLSEKLSSLAGRERATAFITKYDYPLVSRKISICAGYFLSEATRLLASGKYDSCISFASGFSLLLYNIAVKNITYDHIKYLDTDLPHMIKEREHRIQAISHVLDQTVIKNIHAKAFNIENAYQKNQKLKDIFPNFHRPIFIADGVSYFLSSGCVDWLIEQMGSYEQSAAMLYYWPENMPQISSLFARVFSDLNKGMILETLKSFWDQSTITKFRNQFPHTTDYSLKEAEQLLTCGKTSILKPILTDPNQYFPVRLITGEK